MKKFPTFIAALIFAIVAILHAWRWWAGIPVTVSGEELPMWTSIAVTVVTGGMSYWLLKGFCCKKCS